jgi:hypothetical protein
MCRPGRVTCQRIAGRQGALARCRPHWRCVIIRGHSPPGPALHQDGVGLQPIPFNARHDQVMISLAGLVAERGGEIYAPGTRRQPGNQQEDEGNHRYHRRPHVTYMLHSTFGNRIYTGDRMGKFASLLLPSILLTCLLFHRDLRLTRQILRLPAAQASSCPIQPFYARLA